jgi:hypothetical protein
MVKPCEFLIGFTINVSCCSYCEFVISDIFLNNLFIDF